MKKRTNGFTLIELLVVIAIIGILATIVLTSLGSANKKAADAKNISQMSEIQKALELYYNTYGTYKVANSGYNNNGNGFADYVGLPQYATAVTQALTAAGFLGTFPLESSPNMMIYYCTAANGRMYYSLSTTINYPTAAETAFVPTTCNGVLANGTYGKNYAVQGGL